MLATERAVLADSGWRSYLRHGFGSSCVLYYPSIHDDVLDRSGNGNNGTISGAIWRRLHNGLWYLSFDGTDDYVLVNPIVPDFDEKSTVSMECWARISTGCGENSYIISLPESAAANGIDLRWGSDTIYWDLNTHLDASSVDVTSAVSLNTWYHLVLTYDGTTLTGYKNGASIGSHAVTVGTGLKHDSKRFCVGALHSTSYEITGFVGLPRIYSEALVATKIQGNFNRERHLFGV